MKTKRRAPLSTIVERIEIGRLVDQTEKERWKTLFEIGKFYSNRARCKSVRATITFLRASSADSVAERVTDRKRFWNNAGSYTGRPQKRGRGRFVTRFTMAGYLKQINIFVVPASSFQYLFEKKKKNK